MGLRFSKSRKNQHNPPITFCVGQKVKMFGSDDLYEIIEVKNPFNYTVRNDNDRTNKNISPSDISETGLLEIGTNVICQRFKEIENTNLTGVIIGAKATNPPIYDVWLDENQICKSYIVGSYHVESVTENEIYHGQDVHDLTSSQ